MDSRQPVRLVIPDAIVQRLEAAADPRSEGKSICIEILQQLADHARRVGGAIMAPLNEASIPDVIREFRMG